MKKAGPHPHHETAEAPRYACRFPRSRTEAHHRCIASERSAGFYTVAEKNLDQFSIKKVVSSRSRPHHHAYKR